MSTAPILTDEELASRAIGGDQKAFADLYERYFGKVYDMIARMLRNSADASDVAQDTFMKMLAGLGTRPPHTSFRAWLYTIARNTAIDRIRSTRHMAALQTDESDDEDEGRFYQTAPPASGDDPERTAISEDLAALVWQAARGLNPNEYTLLDMNIRQGLEAEEIAEALGTTRGNVYTMLSRLRDSFEQSFTALLLSRRGRQDCAALNEILARAAMTDELSTQTRRAVNRHASRCDICGDNRRRFVSAAELFGGFVPVLPGLALKDEIFAGLMEQFPAATASAARPSPDASPSASSAAPAQPAASATPTPAASPTASVSSQTGQGGLAGFWASSSMLVKALIVGGAVAVVGTVAAVVGVLAAGSDGTPQDTGGTGGPSAPAAPSGDARVLSLSGAGTLFAPDTYALETNITASSGHFQDVNGDGFLDLVVGDRFDNLGIWLNEGDGSLSAPVKYPTGPAPYHLASGDLNGDGRPDIAVAYAAAGIAVHLGNSDGTFSEAEFYASDINSPNELAVGDFDRDGDMDIASALTNQAVVIFLNDGDGAFGEKVNIPVDSNPFSVHAADLDGDGDLDMAVGSLNSGIWALTNDGNGSFTPALVHEEPFIRTFIGNDVDGDGDIDLVGGGDTGGQTPQYRLVVLRNDGGGRFGAPEYSADLHPIGFNGLMKAADVDLDGDLDIVLSWGGVLEILYNDGGGSFSRRETEGFLPGFSGSSGSFGTQSWLLDVGDVDNDGDADIAISVSGSDSIVVLRNNAVKPAGGTARLNLVVEGDGFVNISSADYSRSVSCGPDEVCVLEVAPGTELTIYTDSPATPGSGARFDRWAGDCGSFGNNPYPSLTVSEDMSCTARFTR
ncbi:MAG: sigma-70 family RNA polymerase sigma factor [Chloroflexi bacterium]|nr:sigma-70 family RNA polymerase sigma factor [Chloroflexota bacterium]